MENPKTKKIVYIISAFFAVFGYFYVDYALKKETVQVIDTTGQQGEEAEEVKPAIALLDVTDGTRNWHYRALLTNSKSIGDFLEEIRNVDGFTYEITAYTYGTEISAVNGIKPSEGEHWIFYRGDKDVTYNIQKESLSKNEEENKFRLELVEITHNEELQ